MSHSDENFDWEVGRPLDEQIELEEQEREDAQDWQED